MYRFMKFYVLSRPVSFPIAATAFDLCQLSFDYVGFSSFTMFVFHHFSDLQFNAFLSVVSPLPVVDHFVNEVAKQCSHHVYFLSQIRSHRNIVIDDELDQ